MILFSSFLRRFYAIVKIRIKVIFQLINNRILSGEKMQHRLKITPHDRYVRMHAVFIAQVRLYLF